MLKFLKIFSLESVVGVGLVTSLLLAICMGLNELSMSISSGLVGYIGHGKIQHYDTNQYDGNPQ